MKQLFRRRLLSLVLAVCMVIGLLPAGFVTAQENDGITAMNEAYAARESLAPVGTAFTIDTLLAWTPETDPDAAYSRASIPLADRQGGFVVNPLANPEAKLMLCANNDNPVAQGSENFFSYAFNYWQYTDSFIYWGGNGDGFIQGPTGELIDAAHTNGVPIVGTLGFPWGYGTGYVEQVSQFCQKAEDGSFPVADKLIEVMDYYGFDGWFFNQESYGCDAEIANRLNEMMRYMHEKRPDIIISWYDSMINTGSVSYQDAVNDTNKFWMEADENGNWGVDEFFMNYNWYEYDVTQTISTLKSINRSQFDAFAGFNVQANVYGDRLRDYLLVDEDGLAQISLALYYANQTQTMASDGEEFHRTEQAYYVNAAGDPRVNNVNVTDSTVTEWAGMSRFFADKTPVTSAPFVTDFNTGHGKGWFVDGEKLRDAEWSYQSNQDVLPTFTWIIDSEGSKLSGSYDFSDAFNGGSSVKFAGDLTAAQANDILLYSVVVPVEDGMTLNLTAKGGLENASLVAYLGDAATDSYETCEQVAVALNDGEGWVETSADLSAYAGKTLYGIGLKVESETDVSGYQLNLGRLSILDKTRAALNGPKEVKLEDILYTDAYSAEARVQWSKVTGASSYEIYKVHGDGSKTFLMETPNTAYYIPVLTRNEDETDVTLEIVPINRSGVRGNAAELIIDWAYGNDDSERLVITESVNVCLGATVTGYSEQGDGAECDKALDGISGNGSKWWASGVGDWFSIDLGEEKTVRRLRVEHAEYGGEGKELNTSAFTVSYKDASGNWVQAYSISGNTAAVTDVLLDTPVTAREWRLYINGIGPSPWSAVNIYEWQMFETGFSETEPVPMHFASAFNGEGATDTFTLTNLPAERTVKVYSAAGELIGEATGTTSVTLENLDFGTADAGRVYYTTTESGYGESVKFSAPFDAENAEKSAPAEDVEFVEFSQPGSVSSSAGDDIYTTMTVNGLAEGDVVYVLGDWAKTSLPVAAGETSVSIDGVRVVRAGGTLTLQVKRAGQLISDAYTVETPAFDEPTATIQVFAENESGETLTGVRFSLLNEAGEEAAQLSTTSDSGAKAEVALGTYTIRNTESPEGYGLAADAAAIVRIEGWSSVYTIVIPEGSVEPDAADKSALDSLIAVCETYTADDYTEESWNAFQTVLEEARAVSADPDATQDEVDAVREKLAQAMMALEQIATYTVTIAEMVGGTVTADVTEAREGQTVTLTVTPDEGYALVAGSLKVNGEAIEGSSFVMPAADVTVTAEFENAHEKALAAALEAQAAAEAARAAAEEAQRKAEEAAAAAEEAAASAAEDKAAAEAARQEAEEAQAAAEAAQKAAEDAQAAAEAAQTAAEAHDAAAAEAAAAAARSAQEVAELYEQIAAMKAEMAEYLKDAQKAAEEAEEHNKAAAAAELACAKYEALIELALYADPDDYDAVTAAEIQAAIDAGVEAINAAETVEAVAEALAEALAAIDLAAYQLPFVDVPADAFYRDAVKWALIEGITTGTSETTFSPDKTVTRAEAVTFLWRAAGEPVVEAENPFTDVSESDFYYQAVLWAVENGITTGMTETTFGPYSTANRAQIVTFLHRAMGQPAASAANPFTDMAEGDWYYEAVLWAVENGITTGMTANTFGANGVCNRAQMVTFLYRAYA